MCEVIVVTSGKGGVGKTPTSANVGTGLASMGKKVALIDNGYRIAKSGCRNGTGKPDYLQSGRCDRGKLPDEAGADSRQKIS